MLRPIQTLWQKPKTEVKLVTKVYLFDPTERTLIGGFPVYVGNEDTDGNPQDLTELSPARSQALYNHSPNGFNWGYGGSGAAQCALGLLLDVTDNDDTALRWYQTFKWDVIAHMPTDKKAQLSEKNIQEWLQSRETL